MITLAGGTGLVGKSLTQALMRDGEQGRVLLAGEAFASIQRDPLPCPKPVG
jgi:NAD dependent epimerase/dehydratase family enzyme